MKDENEEVVPAATVAPLPAQTATVASLPDVVYTAGRCINNGAVDARAGIGVYWDDNSEFNISKRLRGKQTGNRAELHAVIMALEQCLSAGKKEITVRTGSQFIVNCMTKWIKRWKENQWKLADGQPVRNQEDLERLDWLCEQLEVTWEQVPNAGEHPGDVEADRLASRGTDLEQTNGDVPGDKDKNENLGSVTDLDALLPARKRRKAVARAIALRRADRRTSLLSLQSWISDIECPAEAHIAALVENRGDEYATGIGVFWCDEWSCINVSRRLEKVVKYQEALCEAAHVAIRQAMQHGRSCVSIHSDLEPLDGLDYPISVSFQSPRPKAAAAAKRLAERATQMELPMGPARVYVCGVTRPAVSTSWVAFWGSGDERNRIEVMRAPKFSFRRAELKAAINAIKEALGRGMQSLVVCCSDDYAVNCMENWITQWVRNDWLTATDSAVRNREELEQLVDLCNQINVEWVYERTPECHALACAALRLPR